jgi:hypothetical protein
MVLSEVERTIEDGGDDDGQATFAESTGIGAGSADSDGVSRVSTIVLNGGRFKTKGISAAGIGSGYVWTGESSVGSLTIHDGNFTIGVEMGAAIGSGSSSLGTSKVESVMITGGTFEIDIG